MRSKKELAVLLSKLKSFEHPDPRLEQYPTDSEIAASILWEACMNGEIQHKKIADFGCGTGVLGIGALVLGAKHVVFLEIDPKVFPILMENLYILEKETGKEYGGYDIIQSNVETYNDTFDIVLENPPFGTRQKHIDMIFLKKAIQQAPLVYSLHKTTTEDHVEIQVKKQHAKITGKTNYKFPLKNTMPQHHKRIQNIDVTCFKIES